MCVPSPLAPSSGYTLPVSLDHKVVLRSKVTPSPLWLLSHLGRRGCISLLAEVITVTCLSLSPCSIDRKFSPQTSPFPVPELKWHTSRGFSLEVPPAPPWGGAPVTLSSPQLHLAPVQASPPQNTPSCPSQPLHETPHHPLSPNTRKCLLNFPLVIHLQLRRGHM